MKIIRLFVFICHLLIPFALVAQTPAAIEADLLKSFKRIDYWDEKGRASTGGNISWSDSIKKANVSFSIKLKNYTEKYPSTITQNFALLKKEHLDISSSTDGLFRIYSWDTWTGGTMHFFESVFQYKVGPKTISILDTPKNDGDNRPNYRKLYTFNINNRTYYFPVYIDIGSTKDLGGGLQIFDIENGKLNQDVKIIKAASGMSSQLNYWYDRSVSDCKTEPEISFDEASKTINLPSIASNGKFTCHYITYKFTGQYFERIKN
jgi:hypothetical protein